MRKLFILVCFFLITSAHAQQKKMIVALDGSGEYTSIQAAIDAVPAFPIEGVTIFIKSGTYKEKIIIPSWKTNISLIGESIGTTIISWNDYAGKGNIDTFTSYTMLVRGNDFSAENITIENTAGPVGQAVALHVEADRCVFKNCRIMGDQDTLYAGVDNSRQYYVNCYIEGTTDFIFGPAVAVFENCTIHCKKNSYITAANTPEKQPYGFVFINCNITAGFAVTQVYLGRPWRPYAKTVYIDCSLGKHIRPEGWHNWDKPKAEKTTFYAEFNSRGPGAPSGYRVPWSKQLTKKELKNYDKNAILSGKDNWIINTQE